MASTQTPTYDLMLLLGTDVPDERRASIVENVEQAIGAGGGSIVSKHDWGVRNLAYEIRHQTDAEYHLTQFTGPAALLETLDHTLKITDGVTRFRIIRQIPGTPPPPEVRREPVAAEPVAAEPVAAAPAEAEAPPPDE
jgi:small subunit ribosomal protein S6